MAKINLQAGEEDRKIKADLETLDELQFKSAGVKHPDCGDFENIKQFFMYFLALMRRRKTLADWSDLNYDIPVYIRLNQLYTGEIF